MGEDIETTKQNFIGAAKWIVQTVAKGDPKTIAGAGFSGVGQKAPGQSS